MSSALINALIKSISPEKICVSNRTNEKAEKLSKETGCKCFYNNKDVLESSEIIVLGIKPQNLSDFFNNEREYINKENNQTFVTMAAGVTTEKINNLAEDEFPVIRIMPNTPVSISEGVVLVTKNDLVKNNIFNEFLDDFKGAGTLVKISEDLIDAGSVISGCSPAYIYMYIEALKKAGISLGLDPDTAELLSKETVRGTAGLSIKSDKSLETLRKDVCSPGGTTIEGVKSLNESNLDEIVKKALEAAYKRTLELKSND